MPSYDNELEEQMKDAPTLMEVIEWVMRRVNSSPGEMDRVTVDISAVGSEAFRLKYEIMKLLDSYGKKIKNRSPTAYNKISMSLKKLRTSKFRGSSPSLTVRIDGRKILSNDGSKDPVAVSFSTYVGKDNILVTLFPSMLGIDFNKDSNDKK